MSQLRYKVLFLASWYPNKLNPLNGIFIRKHAEAISRFCEVIVLFISPDSGLKDKVYDVEIANENNVYTLRVYFRPNNSKVKVIAKLINLIRYIRGGYYGLKIVKEKFGRPDISHVNVALPAGILALILKYLKGIPYIITEHWTGYTSYDGRYDNSPVWIKFLTKELFRNAEAITAVSNFLLESLKERKLVKKLSFVTQNIVDIQENFIGEKENGIKISILTVSLLNDIQKNISGLIRAFSKIVDKCTNLELHIIGDGRDRERLEDLARDLDLLNKSVFFHGYVPNDNLYEYFSKSNFFVLNSNFETFSVATAEAIAHGIPVVVTRCGGPEEFVNNEVGILVERQNEESLVNGIEYMINNWDKYDRKKLQEYIKSKFSYEVVGKKFYEVYKSTVTLWEVGQCGKN